MASVPLLLTLLCLEYSESNDFPHNRAELYERAIETLLKKWDISRQVRRDDTYKQLTISRKKDMFARMAFGTFTENQYFIREWMLAKMIEKYIAQLPDFNPTDFKHDGYDILKAASANHGIFVERAKGVYSFAHLTFQEYFTAKFIVDNQLSGSIEKLVDEYFRDTKWKEVFLLVAGLLDNADELLMRMRIKSNKALDNPEINALFQLAKDSLLPIENNYPDEIRRRFAISYAQKMSIFSDIVAHTGPQPLVVPHQPIVLDDSSLHQIAKQALSNTVGMKKVLIVMNFHKALTHVYNLSLDFAKADSFDFAPQLGIDLSYLKTSCTKKKFTKQSDEELEQYISDNLLILLCLKSGRQISTQIREKLLHELFLPREGLL